MSVLRAVSFRFSPSDLAKLNDLVDIHRARMPDQLFAYRVNRTSVVQHLIAIAHAQEGEKLKEADESIERAKKRLKKRKAKTQV